MLLTKILEVCSFPFPEIEALPKEETTTIFETISTIIVIEMGIGAGAEPIESGGSGINVLLDIGGRDYLYMPSTICDLTRRWVSGQTRQVWLCQYVAWTESADAQGRVADRADTLNTLVGIFAETPF